MNNDDIFREIADQLRPSPEVRADMLARIDAEPAGDRVSDKLNFSFSLRCRTNLCRIVCFNRFDSHQRNGALRQLHDSDSHGLDGRRRQFRFRSFRRKRRRLSSVGCL